LGLADKSGISLIEHPSIPHFFNSQIVALFGHTYEFVQTSSYFYNAECNINNLAGSNQNTFDKQNVRHQMQNIRKYIMCRQINRMTPVERVLSLVLTQPTPVLQKALNSFRTQAAQMKPY
jgi:hypothetical protein